MKMMIGIFQSSSHSDDNQFHEYVCGNVWHMPLMKRLLQSFTKKNFFFFGCEKEMFQLSFNIINHYVFYNRYTTVADNIS